MAGNILQFPCCLASQRSISFLHGKRIKKKGNNPGTRNSKNSEVSSISIEIPNSPLKGN
jgi:hypothetical protein